MLGDVMLRNSRGSSFHSFDETGWEKLADRRTNHKLVLFHKMVNREVPAYLSNLLPDTCLTYITISHAGLKTYLQFKQERVSMLDIICHLV
jgi:hypothetical protein